MPDYYWLVLLAGNCRVGVADEDLHHSRIAGSIPTRIYWMIFISDVVDMEIEFLGTNGILIGNTYVTVTLTR